MESLLLHGKLVAEKTAHARALTDIIQLQRKRMNGVDKTKQVVWLLATEQAERKSSMVVEQLKNHDLADIMEVNEQSGTPATLLK